MGGTMRSFVETPLEYAKVLFIDLLTVFSILFLKLNFKNSR